MLSFKNFFYSFYLIKFYKVVSGFKNPIFLQKKNVIFLKNTVKWRGKLDGEKFPYRFYRNKDVR